MRADENAQALTATRKRGISGSTLKLVAIITMFIDHLGAGVVGRCLSRAGIGNLDITNMPLVDKWMDENISLYSIYNVMRLIGRIAFPIFCYLLVQGFLYTRNRKKYAFRLFLFALLSEIPFDLLFRGKVLETGYQNVMFTLLIGLLTMLAYEWVEKREGLSPILRTVAMIGVVALGMAVAKFLKTDYGAFGVLAILLLYILRNRGIRQLIAGGIAFAWEFTAPLAFVLIGFYNGKRGWKLKYFFYAFYPVHLLLLYGLCLWLGLTAFPSM